MRCRGVSAVGLFLRSCAAAAAATACLVACALQPVAWARAVTGGLTTARADHEYFRGDFFPELVNPPPAIEPGDNERRRLHKHRCTDCVDDQEPDAYERRVHGHRCVDCGTGPGGSLSTAAYWCGGGGGGGDGHRRRPSAAVISKRRDHRHRVIAPPTRRRRRRPVIVTETKAVVEVTVISEFTTSVSPLNRVFNVRWNEVIKKTTKISPQRTGRYIAYNKLQFMN